MFEYEYKAEIDENVPRAKQPSKITISLKPHQLACLYKAIEMEQKGGIKYKFDQPNNNILVNNDADSEQVDVKTNIGILGDIVGYGKTLTALAIVASSNINDIHVNNQMNVSYCNSINYSYLSYTKKNTNIIPSTNIINSTLIIVPRGPVYVQWQYALKTYTKLSYIAIDNLTYIRKHLPERNSENNKIIDYFNQYDVVLIKNTTLDTLVGYYNMHQTLTSSGQISTISFIKRWKRIMIDEAHDICNNTPLMYYEYIWLISGTYENILYSLKSYRNVLYNIRNALNYDTIDFILVKCKKEFVENSFKIPVPNEKYYLCKMMTHMNVIKKFLTTSVLEKINAGDISGAMKDIGGKADTQDNVIELISNEFKRELQNKETEKIYVNSLDIPDETKQSRIRLIDKDIMNVTLKLEYLKERISELNKKMCSICMYDIDVPIILECTHSYCASCIVRWMSKNMNCPECRYLIKSDKIISIVNEVKESSSLEEQIYSKTDTLLNIIDANSDGKYLVFSKYDSGFSNLMNILREKNITCSELKGNTQHMIKVLDKFKRGEIKVILLNTNFAGSGIDISYATDVIIYHSMGLAKYQAVGRAQRVGRTDTLNVHYLCYEHEMSNCIQ